MTDLESLSSHYGVNPQYFHDYVKSKFDNVGLTDYDDFLSTWRQCLNQLEQSRPANAKTAYRYDCTVLVNEAIIEQFTFQAGDIINAGVGGSALKYHDGDMAAKVYQALMNKGVSHIPINDGNITFWNDAIRAGKVQIPTAIIKEIISKRGA